MHGSDQWNNLVRNLAIYYIFLDDGVTSFIHSHFSSFYSDKFCNEMNDTRIFVFDTIASTLHYIMDSHKKIRRKFKTDVIWSWVGKCLGICMRGWNSVFPQLRCANIYIYTEKKTLLLSSITLPLMLWRVDHLHCIMMQWTQLYHIITSYNKKGWTQSANGTDWIHQMKPGKMNGTV